MTRLAYAPSVLVRLLPPDGTSDYGAYTYGFHSGSGFCAESQPVAPTQQVLSCYPQRARRTSAALGWMGRAHFAVRYVQLPIA